MPLGDRKPIATVEILSLLLPLQVRNTTPMRIKILLQIQLANNNIRKNKQINKINK